MSLQINPNNVYDQWNRVAQDLGQAVSNAATTLTGSQAPATQGTTDTQAQQLFEQQFADMAQDPDAFHATMQQVYGESYDYDTAESLRQRALAGDFSWLPPVRTVSAETLGGANGAYDAEAGVIYLNEDLSPELAAQTYVEEAGHHLDTLLNTTDTVGDEGEMFRRIMSGENLTAAQIAEIRAENDKGTIYVDGKAVEVEFWNPISAIGDAVSAVGDAIGDAVDAVGEVVSDVVDAVAGAVGDAVDAVGDAVSTAVDAVVDTVTTFASGLFDMTFGAASLLLQGRLTDAMTSVVDGLDKAFIRAPQRAVNGVIDATEKLLNAPTYLLGDTIGGFVRDQVIARGVDIQRGIFNTTTELARSGFRTMLETPITFIDGVGDAIGHAVRGEWGDAAGAFGMAFVNAGGRFLGGMLDQAMIGLQGGVDVVGTALFLHEPSRPLTDDEKAAMREIYGDSVDLDSVRIHEDNITTKWFGMAPHAVGNNIYMPTSATADDGTVINYVDANGDTNLNGQNLLAHELGHTWQNQNGGSDYIAKALFSQAVAAVSGGDRGGAYEWRDAIAEGKSYNEMNPEQQAELIQELHAALVLDRDGNGELSPDDFDPPLSDEEFAFVLDAWAQVRRGELV